MILVLNRYFYLLVLLNLKDIRSGCWLFLLSFSLFCIETLKFQRKKSGKYNSSINPIFAILRAFLCKIWVYLHINLKLSMSFPRYCGMSDKFFEN